MPSLKEGFPTVVLEAMSYGIPVVGYNIGGLPELVRHGLDGLLVPATDREPLRCQLFICWKTRELSDKLSKSV